MIATQGIYSLVLMLSSVNLRLPCLLDGILDNETELNILEHTTDTAGYTDVMFALFDVLGLRFSPRIRDIGKKSLYRLDKDNSYLNLDILLKGNRPIQF